ncbi:MAG: hypothetical protein NTY04_03175 [Candidatus Staskawiczbacteria bacterium]|nr:hypothetical protein [Candidatus Staskawiczbacteria bacterium]
MENGKACCNCSHHKIVPCCITLIGLAFLLLQLNIFLTAYVVGIIWPVLLIVIGLVKMRGGNCKCC